MPIKPENRHRYPRNWGLIRGCVLGRAGNRCEQCGVDNGAMISRGRGEDAGTYQTRDGQVFDALDGVCYGLRNMALYDGAVAIRVVLTIAHLDHHPENCDLDNLRALCQRCHLAYDAKHHAVNARITRRSRKALADLFDFDAANAAAAPERSLP